MGKLEEINAYLEEQEITTLTADGFDDAILGLVTDFNAEPRIAYSKIKCIEILMKRDGMDYEEAMEYFDYNVSGAYVGEKTPIWVDDEMFCD